MRVGSENFSTPREVFCCPKGWPLEIIAWHDGRIRLLDQTRLPEEEVHLDIADVAGLAAVIREMRIRGAPALGVAAAYGLALAAIASPANDCGSLLADLRRAAGVLAATRPTAVNLTWALRRVLTAAEAAPDAEAARQAALAEARRIHHEGLEADRRLSELGADLIPDGAAVLTHCNTGALATAGYGTALGVLRAAHEQGKRIRVYATETRPLLQGARLTAWELLREGIPATLIVDSAAGGLLRRGIVSCVVVGADRIAANGDVANKVGTYGLAVLAHENGVPFYVAAPSSTVDLSLASGDDIPIEERAPEEVTTFAGRRVAAEGIQVANPAFDVTPHRYLTAIITERGIAREPYDQSLASLVGAAGVPR
jgi:methylthioribose-1-phosphate isomerase